MIILPSFTIISLKKQKKILPRTFMLFFICKNGLVEAKWRQNKVASTLITNNRPIN